MRKSIYWKVSLSLILTLNYLSSGAFAIENQIGSLSEGSCWYENKETISIASFNDKSTFSASRAEIESSLEVFAGAKIEDMNIVLHCGGYGASLVFKVTTESHALCVWTKFDNGNLGIRSIGVLEKNSNELCDGYKWGEFIMGIESPDFVSELQNTKWSSMIKEIKSINNKVVKVVLTKEFEFREQEVIDLIQENFRGKKLIRYIEFNGFHHPIGESIQLK